MSTRHEHKYYGSVLNRFFLIHSFPYILCLYSEFCASIIPFQSLIHFIFVIVLSTIRFTYDSFSFHTLHPYKTQCKTHAQSYDHHIAPTVAAVTSHDKPHIIRPIFFLQTLIE
eukprot:105355_1